MKEPNFFLVGAPKCGTTALASYLSRHEQVFMSDPKEPHHFNIDHDYGRFKDDRAYMALFADASDAHRAVGEASVWYLYSEVAVPRILERYPHARIIVMLRNPVEMAVSLHQQKIFSGYETVRSFEAAWALQEDRRRGKSLPIWNPEPKLLLYRDACALGTQLEQLRLVVPGGQLLSILYDDFRADPRAVWLELESFLELDDDSREDFPVINAAKERRSLLLKRINDVYSKIRSVVGLSGFGTGIFTALNAWNAKKRRYSISEGVAEQLIDAFADEISRLEVCLGRDLSAWRRVPGSGNDRT